MDTSKLDISSLLNPNPRSPPHLLESQTATDDSFPMTSHISNAKPFANPLSISKNQRDDRTRTTSPISSFQPASPEKKSGSKWSSTENALVVFLKLSGMSWKDISKRLPGRTHMSCRKHYRDIFERRSEFLDEMKDKMARLYDSSRSDMWIPLAREFDIPWQAVEAMHWQMGRDEMCRRAGVKPFALFDDANIPPPSIPKSSLPAAKLEIDGTFLSTV